LAPGEAENVKPERLEVGVASAVLLKGRPCAVRAPAVHFDDQALVAPEEVHLVAIDLDVDLRGGQAMPANYGKEERLELAAGSGSVAGILNGQSPELGLSDGCGELSLGERGSEIGERPCRCRDRDPKADDAVSGGQGRGTMKGDAALPPAASMAGNGNVDGPVLTLRTSQHSPEPSGAAVTEDGALPAGKHCCHPPALKAKPGMANRVNLAMNAVKPTIGDATRNTGWGKAGIRELRRTYDAVLARRHLRDRGVRAASVAFFSHSERKAPSPSISPPSSPGLRPGTPPVSVPAGT
jgi:hypothetical protein